MFKKMTRGYKEFQQLYLLQLVNILILIFNIVYLYLYIFFFFHMLYIFN